MSDRILEFDTLEAIAVSIAAYEVNSGYVKTSEYDYNANMPHSEIKKYPNKELVRSYFGIDHYSTDAPRPPLVKVTADHRKKAEDIRNYSKKAVFKVLGKKPVAIDVFGVTTLIQNSDYEERLYQLLNQDKIGVSDLGFVASSPFYYENGKKRDYSKNRLNEIDSKHVGTIGGKIVLDGFEVVRNTKSKNYNGHVIQGICDGNLFLYFTTNPADHIKVGDLINIAGKIKDHIMEKDTIPMTKLNYVSERTNKNGNITQETVVRTDSDSNLF